LIPTETRCFDTVMRLDWPFAFHPAMPIKSEILEAPDVGLTPFWRSYKVSSPQIATKIAETPYQIARTPMSSSHEILERRKEDIMGPKKAPNKNVNAHMLTFRARSKFVSSRFGRSRDSSYRGKRKDRARLRDRLLGARWQRIPGVCGTR